jgi:hypothetical protein
MLFSLNPMNLWMNISGQNHNQYPPETVIEMKLPNMEEDCKSTT